MYVCVCVCVYVCVCVCMHVCMYVCMQYIILLQFIMSFQNKYLQIKRAVGRHPTCIIQIYK